MADRCFEPIVFDKKTCVQPLFAIQIEDFRTPISSGPLKAVIGLDAGYCLDEGLCLGQVETLRDSISEVCLDRGFCLDEGLELDTLDCKPAFLDCLAIDGFSSNITQKLDPSRSSTSSISSFNMRVLDTDCNMSGLYARGNVIKDILNSRVDIFSSFCGPDLAYPEEYKKIFRGFVTKVCSGPGYVDFQIDHPDKKKQQELFAPFNTTLSTSNVSSAAGAIQFLTPTEGVKQPVDCLRTAVIINGEVMEYTQTFDSANTTIAPVIRNQNEFSDFCIPDTTSHEIGDEVASMCILEGNPVDLALKIMRSGSDEPGPYNVLPEGLSMNIEDVDIERHEFFRDTYLLDAFVRIYLTEGTDAKSLIEEELYKPFGLYSVPRETKASLNYFQPPIYPDTVPVFDQDCIVDCKKIRICRSLNRNFFNQVLYKYDKNPCEDEYVGGTLSLNQESIDCYEQKETFEVCSQGLRSDFGAQRLARDSSLRRLDRFAFAAEYIEGLEVFFQAAINVEIGDTVEIDFSNLGVTNSETGKRDFETKLYEVVNKKFNVKSGRAFLDLLDTGFTTDFTNVRNSGIAPCSESKTYTGTNLELEQNPCYDEAEVTKWCVGDKVTFRNEDYTVCFDSVITTIGETDITLADAVPAGIDCVYIELAGYDAADQTECTSLRFAYIADNNDNFSDGTIPYTIA